MGRMTEERLCQQHHVLFCGGKEPTTIHLPPTFLDQHFPTCAVHGFAKTNTASSLSRVRSLSLFRVRLLL